MPAQVQEHRAESTSELREQFEFEKVAARRLMTAPSSDRHAMYSEIYAELYSRFRYLQKDDSSLSSARTQADLILKLIDSRSVVLEIGCGRAYTAALIGPKVRLLYLADVACHIEAELPSNAEFRLLEGGTLPFDDESVAVCFHSDVMEHLHPEDGAALLREMRRVLKPGGWAVVITPNRLSGPHNVARYFQSEVEGLHLKEYLSEELVDEMKAAGFAGAEPYYGARGLYLPVPAGLSRWIETALRALPRSIRRARIVKGVACDRVVARKAGSVRPGAAAKPLAASA